MGYLGSLEKMKVMAYQKSNFTSKVGEFSVMINPEKYSHTYKICYNDVRAQGSNGSSPDFNKTMADVVKMELVFDGTGVVPTAVPGLLPYTKDGVAPQLEAWKALVFTFNGNIHSPNYLTLVWGTLLFRCRLQEMNVTYTLFKPDGTPLRARVDASFIGFNDEKELALKANKTSPDLTHVVVVRGGDTLPLLCYQIYGDSGYYLQVAQVNGLTEFRRLVPGSQLVFPPLAENVQ